MFTVCGTVGNVLSGIVMTRRSLKKSSTSYLISILAVVDTLVLWVDLSRQWSMVVYNYDIRNISR